ncbi:5-oxoprolinase/urea amidolyase family protein [Melaminivora jejuensis]|nr:5-oxoprolinase/urea amidolyase family protein [Melaminivora jejuensis]UHJ65823.1 5-oxoprolinase/urea amidolyase family protein [Melaminivora jejuensis]
MSMRFLPAGDGAVLLELPDLAHTLALHRALSAQPLPGVCEVVPAARTLLVYYDRQALVALPELMAALRTRAAQVAAGGQAYAGAPGRLVEIPVRYDGADLPEVAELLGISVAEVMERHTAQPWQAAFAGFAPGFVYLTGGHPCFQLPRRASPRVRVPAGSVALAGDFSAVYPGASPGGWQLIGVTEVPMWDLQRAEPAYVQPGFRVQFRNACSAGRHISLPGLPSRTAQGAGDVENAQDFESKTPQTQYQKAIAAIEIVATGLQTLVQDAGRHGLAGLGVSPSGALDAPAMRLANRLVGNPVDQAVLESLLGGLQLRSQGRTTLAVTGARVALTLQAADGRQWPVASHTALALDDGDLLSVAAPEAGVRSYVAVRGGWQVAPVLGSCASDTLAQIGPPALQAGQRLAVGAGVPQQALRAVQEPAPASALPNWPRAGDAVVLDVLLGPRTDWFTPEALALLQEQDWLVTPRSSRVGMRLHGQQPLARSRPQELPSEGTVTGAIQVPADGQPVLFLADHPLTGGYPVIAVVASHHLALAAQTPVGCRLRLRVIAPFAPAA